jgi:hypothetical protein
MRLLMVLGGAIGFSIGVLMGFAHDCPPLTMLWRASVAALLSGVVLRWWGRVWMESYRQAQRQKMTMTVPTQDKAAL